MLEVLVYFCFVLVSTCLPFHHFWRGSIMWRFLSCHCPLLASWRSLAPPPPPRVPVDLQPFPSNSCSASEPLSWDAAEETLLSVGLAFLHHLPPAASWTQLSGVQGSGCSTDPEPAGSGLCLRTPLLTQLHLQACDSGQWSHGLKLHCCFHNQKKVSLSREKSRRS